MKAFETAPAAHQPTSNFYPLPQMLMPATGLEDSDEDKSAVVMAANQRRSHNRQKKQQYLDMPRSSDPEVLNFVAGGGGLTASEAILVGDGEDDQQIREMENLLAEIGQDVSELKVRGQQITSK